ncbi:protein kinase domain-containing protein [Nannocystis pusilla]|uniref:protein kinase domain-containing protein n=1 Tax=Nannocystis pusilla TaxID=889268 RepID=UPI003B7CD4F8
MSLRTPNDRPGGEAGDDEPAVEPRRIGRFALLRRLGAGAMGVVYAAYDPQLDRKVAVKLLKRGDGEPNTRWQDRLLREAQALAKLSHPNVVQIHEVGFHGDEVFVAMEFVTGMTLRTWLSEQRRSWREVAAVFAQAARGLAAAHAAGLVHRDVKPDNVLVGSDGRVRVVDFGLVRFGDEDDDEHTDEVPLARAQATRTASGILLGTPAYMSPEQFRGRPADALSDQFSLCVALYEALHGERPFAGETADEVAQAVVRGQLAPRLERPVPAWLQRLVLRGLAHDPGARWPNLDVLAAELARDHGRRRRVLALAAAATAALAAAIVAVFGSARGATARRGRSRRRSRPAACAPPRRASTSSSAPVARPTPPPCSTPSSRCPSTAPPAPSPTPCAAGATACARATTSPPPALPTPAPTRPPSTPPPRDRSSATSCACSTSNGRGTNSAPCASCWPARTPKPVVGPLRRGGVRPPRLPRGHCRPRPQPRRRDPRRPRAAGRRLGRGHPARPRRHRRRHPARPRRRGARALPPRRQPRARPPRRRPPDPQTAGGPQLRPAEPVRPAAAPLSLGPDEPPLLITWSATHRRVSLSAAGPERLAELVSVTADEPLGADVADLDGDGQQEVYVGTGPYGRVLLSFRPLADGTWRIDHPHPETDATNSDISAVLAADLDGDGAQELALAAGPWRAFDVRVLRPGKGRALELVARRKLGAVVGLATLRAADGERLLVAAKTDGYPSKIAFSASDPAGPPAGVYLLRLKGRELETVRFLPAPRRAGAAAPVDLHRLDVGDLDGDGLDDIILGVHDPELQPGFTVIHRQRTDGSFGVASLAGFRPVALVEVDGDPAAELVARTTVATLSQETWLLGAGAEATPTLQVARAPNRRRRRR